MTTKSEQLWDAVYRIGSDDGTGDKIRIAGMLDRRQLADTLADIDRLLATAKAIMVAKADEDTLQRAREVLVELREQRQIVEAKLRGE